MFGYVRKFLGLAIPSEESPDADKLPDLLKGSFSFSRKCFTFEAYVKYVRFIIVLHILFPDILTRHSDTLDRLLVDNLFWRNTKVLIEN